MRRFTLCFALLLTCLTGGLVGGTSPAVAAPQNCPGAFQMLHDDQIGTDFQIPAGGYLIKVADPRKLSCTQAVQAFSVFLSLYDGAVLPKPWVRIPQRPIFAQGDASLTAFSIRQVAGLDPAVPTAGNPTANGCPGYYRLLDDDHVGLLSMPKGAYRVSVIDPTQFTCAQALTQLKRFLIDVDGRPTSPWRMDTRTGTFRFGPSFVGFRVKAAVGVEPAPLLGDRLPSKGQPRKCSASFRSLAFDRVNRLQTVPGNYMVFLSRGSGLTCTRAFRLFGSFLRAKGNRLPKPWSVDGGTGVFKRGRRAGFRVKPELRPVAQTPTTSAR